MAITDTELKATSSAPPKAAAAPAPPATSASKVVIVDIGERQSTSEVRSLLKGEGKLIDHVEKILADLVTAGTVAGTAQPVVFVVRELSTADDEDDLDD